MRRTEQLEKKLRKDGRKHTDLPRRRLVWGWRDAGAIPALLQYTEEIAQRQVEDSGLNESEKITRTPSQVPPQPRERRLLGQLGYVVSAVRFPASMWPEAPLRGAIPIGSITPQPIERR